MRCSLSLMLVLVLVPAAYCQGEKKVPVLIDTDIGSDIDDTFALALALVSPELDVQTITTVGGQAQDRAWLVCRFLTHAGIKGPVVAFGRGKQPDFRLDWQIQYSRHPAAIFNRTLKPAKESAVEVIYQKLKDQPGSVTILALGPLTNIAQLFKEHPDAVKLARRLVVMGGALHRDYRGKPPTEPEWNFGQDPAAAKSVLASGVPLYVVPTDACWKASLTADALKSIFDAHTRLTFQVQNLHELYDKENPVLFDAAAVATVIGLGEFSWQPVRLEIDDTGKLRAGKGTINAQVTLNFKADKLMPQLVARLRNSGPAVLPAEPKNLSRLIDKGMFPAKVHVAEDFDTDIEKRWWMSGKAAKMPSGRALRGVLTQDFDDRQGDMKTSYRAVVFNPVPGPPMGPNTRLKFRYLLKGTDKMRVQLYSLSNGYHRYLSLAEVPQGEWREGAVDMTAMRRPDGSGGPLAENERIDDIQFYVDPRADLLIDDVVLYDAAAAGEKRPFPKRIIYAASFDTGKQGKEWPGDFDIVPHEKPRTWKTAKSVLHPQTKTPWIRLYLKGERKLGQATELSFRYRLAGADNIQIALRHSKSGGAETALFKGHADSWQEGRVTFAGRIESIDEIRFDVPAGGELLLDDVLLYEPAS